VKKQAFLAEKVERTNLLVRRISSDLNTPVLSSKHILNTGMYQFNTLLM